MKLRIGAVVEVIHAAAPTDPDIEALWNRIQTEFHANQRDEKAGTSRARSSSGAPAGAESR